MVDDNNTRGLSKRNPLRRVCFRFLSARALPADMLRSKREVLYDVLTQLRSNRSLALYLGKVINSWHKFTGTYRVPCSQFRNRSPQKWELRREQ